MQSENPGRVGLLKVPTKSGGNCGTNEQTWKEEEKREEEVQPRDRVFDPEKGGGKKKKGFGRECARLPFFGPKDIGGKRTDLISRKRKSPYRILGGGPLFIFPLTLPIG